MVPQVRTSIFAGQDADTASQHPPTPVTGSGRDTRLGWALISVLPQKIPG
jgi:hypothetical protein